MSVIEVLNRPDSGKVPYGKPALVEVPEEFWTPDWCNGLRTRTYIGDICHHSDGSTCVQPPHVNQGMPEPACIPFDPAKAVISVLSGRLSDYVS